jgi:hypothetical protein
MILDQAIKEVQQICGWRSDKVTEITAALQYAQTEREKPNRSLPWFLRKYNFPAFVTIPNVMVYNLPPDYIQDSEEKEGCVTIFLLSSGTNPPNKPIDFRSRTVFLKKQNYESSQIRYFGEWPYVYYNPPGALYDTGSQIGPGTPRDYVLSESYILLYPIPDNIYQVNWTYWAQDTPQSLGQTNQWLTQAPWCLIGDAASKICADLGYAQGMQTAQSVLARAEDNIFRATINRQEAGKRRAMGSKL